MPKHMIAQYHDNIRDPVKIYSEETRVILNGWLQENNKHITVP